MKNLKGRQFDTLSIDDVATEPGKVISSTDWIKDWDSVNVYHSLKSNTKMSTLRNSVAITAEPTYNSSTDEVNVKIVEKYEESVALFSNNSAGTITGRQGIEVKFRAITLSLTELEEAVKAARKEKARAKREAKQIKIRDLKSRIAVMNRLQSDGIKDLADHKQKLTEITKTLASVQKAR